MLAHAPKPSPLLDLADDDLTVRPDPIPQRPAGRP